MDGFVVKDLSRVGGSLESLKCDSLFLTNLLLDVDYQRSHPYVSLPLAIFGGAGMMSFSLKG
ncbi:hypothetical protein PanWU01x14_181250 [Parasponia andersonii]|uniref:Uncharacterized protein n=1 Tax=Parasponia andersonii TaxID=3476 RepID=A0A2P5C5S1_PARAD|nr:hypothetical protein PanWU01x14_181250 [Parasponia andersonii]